MFRASTAANSANVAIVTRPDRRLVMQVRNSAGGLTENVLGSGQVLAGSNYPKWLRLIREGNTFTGFWSIDGQDWREIASVEVNMDANILSGIVASSNNDGELSQVSFSNVFHFSQ